MDDEDQTGAGKPAETTESLLSGAASCSTLESACDLVRQQEYMLSRQKEMLAMAIKHHNEAMRTGSELARENHRLRKELDGYKRGRMWTIIASMLPTIEPRWRDEM